MEMEEKKKEVITTEMAHETKEGNKQKTSSLEDTEVSTSMSANVRSADAESRRSSMSLDDNEECKRSKRRTDKEEYSRSRKEDVLATKEDHRNAKKDEHLPKKEDHTHKKDEYQHNKEEHPGTLRSKPSSASNLSPKSSTSVEGPDGEDDRSVGSPGPKVPPLKIVIPPVESEQGSRTGKNTTRHHPYVVVSNDETSTAVSMVTTSPSSPAVHTMASKEEAHSLASATLTSEEQRSKQRVLRSANSNRDRGVPSNSSTNGGSSGTNSSATSGSSSPIAPELSPQQASVPPKEDIKVKIEPGVRSKVETVTKVKVESTVKVKSEPEEDLEASVSETRSTTVDTSSVELHPRKRKLKSKPEPSHNTESSHLTSFGSTPHPHEMPVTNCYQMFMDIRRQIDVKRKSLFPIQPKPPQGFKDYLMNRCTYNLSGNSVPRLKRRNAEPPEGIAEGMKELYQVQEAERYSLRMQHVVEKEKLVLSVEQEILRVHGRAARALANQALPFSACTILKDEEVYNVITPEQEEKDRNARSRYNGRLFISWLQDVDDKWEKIKEEMLARHHKEAESLNAIQKFKWDLKMRQLGLWKKRNFIPVENYVPMLSVSDDFDLLPE